MSKLISDAYQKLNFELHKSDPSYGTSASKVHAAALAEIINHAKCGTLLDYGCGKGTLKAALQPMCPMLDIREYDPARPGKEAMPQPAEMVVCFDVMEHVEPISVESVLDHIASLTQRIAYFTIGLQPAEKMLADGRNAHISLHPQQWWLDQISPRLRIIESRIVGQGADLMVLAARKN